MATRSPRKQWALCLPFGQPSQLSKPEGSSHRFRPKSSGKAFVRFTLTATLERRIGSPCLVKYQGLHTYPRFLGWPGSSNRKVSGEPPGQEHVAEAKACIALDNRAGPKYDIPSPISFHQMKSNRFGEIYETGRRKGGQPLINFPISLLRFLSVCKKATFLDSAPLSPACSCNQFS